jgi:hypothetical protein
MVETPTAQKTFNHAFILESYRYAEIVFPRLLDDIINPHDVNCILDLCCGQGIWISMALYHFPNASIHGVDFHDVMIPELMMNKRVTFHQGLIANLLGKAELPTSDITILSNISKTHGLNNDNLHTLANITRYIITKGDNGNLERLRNFHQYFSLIRGNPFGNDECLWKNTSF